MLKFFTRLLNRKPKPILIDNTFRIVPAFEWKGETYFMHEDPLNTATGRGLTAMIFMEEILMRCSVDYLKLHIEACDKIFSNPKTINLPMLMKLNNNLKERVEFLVALPEHVFKMASIVFFTKEESPYKYDHKFNEKKIKEWEESEGMYDFFLQTPLKTLLPFLALPENNSQAYLRVQQKISKMHLQQLEETLYKKESTTVI